jgi:ribosomal protein L24E
MRSEDRRDCYFSKASLRPGSGQEVVERHAKGI